MKSAHWAPEEQTMCWSGNDAATCVGGCRNHWWEAVTAPGRGFFPGEGGREGWGSLADQDWLQTQLWPPGWLCQHQSMGAQDFLFQLQVPPYLQWTKGSWGFYREEKTSSVSVPFRGCTHLNHTRAQWWFCGGHPFITKCFSIPRVPLIILC